MKCHRCAPIPCTDFPSSSPFKSLRALNRFSCRLVFQLFSTAPSSSAADAVTHRNDDTASTRTTQDTSLRRPRPNWRNIDSHKALFDSIAQQLNIRQPDDWYKVTTADIKRLGGNALLHDYYGDSVFKALSSIYPEYKLLPWRFSMAPQRFWDDIENHRRFFEWAAEQLGVVHKPDDWYHVDPNDVRKLGGSGLLMKHYGNSLVKALMTLYPDVTWQQWRFEKCQVSAYSFDDRGEDLVRFMQFLAKKFHIDKLDDWYRVSMSQIKKHSGGAAIIRRNGGLLAVLKRLYPHHNWVKANFRSVRSKKSSQRWLKIALRELFPHHEIMEDYLHPELVFEHTKEHMELDIFIPSLGLAFEYHGQQHYQEVHAFGPQSQYEQRDEEKLASCKKAGITLITVPYWWDRTTQSIGGTIAALRPDIVFASSEVVGTPIPTTRPPSPHTFSTCRNTRGTAGIVASKVEEKS